MTVIESETPLAPSIGTDDDIEMRLGADATHLPLIRSVAGNLAIRADFDLDAVADVRLAIDEAVSTLVTRATPGSSLLCRFAVGEQDLRFTATALTDQQEAPSTATFGWRVLSTLTDTAHTWVDAASVDGHGYHVHIELTKQNPLDSR